MRSRLTCPAAVTAALSWLPEYDQIIRQQLFSFSPARGFANLSEGLDAEKLTRFVNRLVTPLGDNVSVAGRLEGKTKTCGVRVNAGESTAAGAKDFAFPETDLPKMNGKSEAVRIYTLLGHDTVAISREYRELETLQGQMLGHYRSRARDAAAGLVAHCEAVDDFGLREAYLVYRDRIADFRRTPPPNGDGSAEALAK